MMFRVLNQTRDTVIAEHGRSARSFFARLKGLMGHPGLAEGEGLIIDPCSSVHSFFMRFPIDVIFLNRANVVVGLTHAMPPNKPYAGARSARRVIELPAGTITSSGTQIGDQIELPSS
ncbi:MAG: DUF192 domain-containing protein [Oscillochloris sp.]|nr:DUF192 domain-containing protein [Oscillochloris sp.]